MPIFVASLLGGLASVAGSLVGRVLLALGIGFVAFQGIQIAIDSLKALAVAQFTALPLFVVQVASVCKVDVAINMVFSAMVARLILQGLTSGAIKKMVIQ